MNRGLGRISMDPTCIVLVSRVACTYKSTRLCEATVRRPATYADFRCSIDSQSSCKTRVGNDNIEPSEARPNRVTIYPGWAEI